MIHFNPIKALSTVASVDGRTYKYVFPTSDGFAVEVTYVDREDKHIICFSTQIGCLVGCRFCVSGLSRSGGRSIVRSLTAPEMVGHIESVIFDRRLGSPASKPLLFSAMGEGEPMLAYREVVAALKMLTCKANSRIALSTSGIKPYRIRDLAHENWHKPLKLQLSIHAPSDSTREQLIPTSAPLADILDAAQYFAERTSFPVELNYVLFDEVNDSPGDAIALAKIATDHDWVIKVNRFNKDARIPFRASPKPRATVFVNRLKALGAIVEWYETDGADISAACGQLSYSVIRTNMR